jgi:hypothetical protein
MLFDSEEPVVEEETKTDETEEKEDKVEEKEDQIFDSDEEIVEEDEEKNEETAPSDESDESSSSSNYQVFAKALYDEGVLSSLEDNKEFEDAESLIESIRGEITGQVDAYKDGLPELVKTIIDKYEDGVDLGQFLNIKKQEQDYGSIKESDLEDNEKLTKSIIKRDLLDLGYAEDEADDEILDIYELGKESTRAKRSLKRVKNRLEAQEEAISTRAKSESNARQEAYKTQLNAIDKSLKGTKEIAGVEITTRVQKDAYKAMTEVVGEVNGVPVNSITKGRMEDPVEFDKNVGLLWVVTDGFKDWSKLKTVSKRKAIKDLEDFVNNPKPGRSNKKVKVQKSGNIYPDETFLTDMKL